MGRGPSSTIVSAVVAIVVLAGVPTLMSTDAAAHPPSFGDSAFLQSSMQSAEITWPTFRLETTAFVRLASDVSPVSDTLRSVEMSASIRTVIQGDARAGTALVTSTFDLRLDYQIKAPEPGFSAFSSDTTNAVVDITPGGATGATTVGKFQLVQRIADPIGTRSSVFAVWVTTGFFEVRDETPSSPQVRHRMFAIIDRTLGASAHLEDDATGAPWVDLAFPSVRDRTGVRYKPLFAFYVADLDGRMNLNVHGSTPATLQFRWDLDGPRVVPQAGKSPPRTTASGSGTWTDDTGTRPVILEPDVQFPGSGAADLTIHGVVHRPR